MISDSQFEVLAEAVHNAWMQQKLAQGFHAPKDCDSIVRQALDALKDEDEPQKEHLCPKCHPDLIPYWELPSEIKDYDRATVKAVLNGIHALGYDLARVIGR